MGPGSRGDRDAERGRRRRHAPRRAPGGRAGDDVHRVAGLAAHDPRPVQDRGRAHSRRDSRRGAHNRHPRALDLLRPLRRDGDAADRVGAARVLVGPGGAGHGGDHARGHPRVPRAVPPFLRWLPHLARGGEDRGAVERAARSPDRRRRHPRAPRARARPRPPGAARERAESRRLLPGARGLEPLLPRRAGRSSSA